MSSINKVFLVGHLGKDPEFRIITDDVAVLSFPLATSENLNKAGVKTEVTEWHNVVMWRSLAQAGERELKKGLLIYLEGKIRTRSYTDKEGIKRYVTEVVAEHFTLLGKINEVVLEPEEIQG